eukprot:CAMPEP_0118867582 /NCGR_PEP_ID=MMETSP1163-20130328/11143_1 /TAXON_ID=124430 /ORGANISM="Phaeomonas parva, Strain CCMP2877" /LENGTH=49 /DNA_ID= /DNA_START= /DNA_END= /DNA_ORIENTATION=
MALQSTPPRVQADEADPSTSYFVSSSGRRMQIAQSLRSRLWPGGGQPPD